jgi:hypothetical protein
MAASRAGAEFYAARYDDELRHRKPDDQAGVTVSVIALVETSENNRGRFVAPTIEAALDELGRRYPVGRTVADRLKRGEKVVTDSYTLALVELDAGNTKKQQSLF